MSIEKSKPGRELERQVAEAYRAMGAWKVEHDVELAGNQIDVYVEMGSTDRSLHRIAVEVKDWRRVVGIDVINKFAPVVDNLRSAGVIDEGVIVSASGYSRQARNAAQTHGLRLLDIADLEAGRVGKQRTQDTVSAVEGFVPAEPKGEHVSRVRFVNREYELGRICTLNGAQFVLIDAPTGYGKTHLLYETRRQLCGLSGKPPEKPRDDYPCIRCALIEFGDEIVVERQVLDAICKQVDISAESVQSVDDLAPELIAMAENPEDQTRKLTTVVLLFDNVDQIRIDDVKSWLVRDLIAGLDKGLDAPRSGIRLRAVLAGRFVAGEWDALGKRHGIKFTLLPLSPFSRDIVEEALRLKAKDVGQSLDPPARSAMARGIARVTGGHPRCMSQVIDHIVERRFGIKYEGSENYFDRIGEEVLRDSVIPIIEELMGSLDDRVADLLWRISIFRRFDQRVVALLFNSKEVEGFASSEEAFGALTSTNLIAPPDSIEAFHTDRIVRRLLTLAMRVEEPELYARLNLIALQIFRAWVDGRNIEVVPKAGPPVYAGELPNKPKDHLQVVLAREYLYHYLQSVETPNEEDLEREARRLYEELDSSLGAYDIPNQRQRLRDALKADWEIEDRICYLVGGEALGEALWEKLLEWACGPPL